MRPGRSVETPAITRLPGATRSGFRKLSYCVTPFASMKLPRVGPRPLKLLIVSPLRADVSCVLAEPTVMAEGSSPGELIDP